MSEMRGWHAAVQTAAIELHGRLERPHAVIVTTEDGLEVAGTGNERLDSGRLAAITSSMSAIGEVVSRESGLGDVRCLMVEADLGYLVMRSTRRDGVGLVVAALVGREALLGLAMHAVAETARSLAR
jgi:hypothetical protein